MHYALLRGQQGERIHLQMTLDISYLVLDGHRPLDQEVQQGCRYC